MDAVKILSAFTRFGSDKSTAHHYEIAYSQILPDEINNLLEIGIANYTPDKSSVHAWHEIYPSANIYAIDVVPEKMINNDFTKSFLVDQSNSEQLINFRDSVGVKFDLIIDDGSHMFDHALLTYQVLKDCLSDNGIYIIEDIQKTHKFTYHTLDQWVEYLSDKDVYYEVLDPKPYLYDSHVIICIYKNRRVG